MRSGVWNQGCGCGEKEGKVDEVASKYVCQGGKLTRMKARLVQYFSGKATDTRWSNSKREGATANHHRDVLPLFAGHTNGRKALKSGVRSSRLVSMIFIPSLGLRRVWQRSQFCNERDSARVNRTATACRRSVSKFPTGFRSVSRKAVT